MKHFFRFAAFLCISILTITAGIALVKGEYSMSTSLGVLTLVALKTIEVYE